MIYAQATAVSCSYGYKKDRDIGSGATSYFLTDFGRVSREGRVALYRAAARRCWPLDCTKYSGEMIDVLRADMRAERLSECQTSAIPAAHSEGGRGTSALQS